MDPNQLPQPNQTPAPPSMPANQPGGNFNPAQYDFITNPQKPPKKSLLPTAGSSKKQRILFVVIGIVVFIVLISLFMSLLSSGSRANIEQLTSVRQQQTELIRVAELGVNKASGEEAKAVATKTKVTVVTQDRELAAILKARKVEISTKSLSGGKNAETDTALNTASQNGRFDEAFIQAVRTQLEEYKKTLKAAYSGSSSQSIREELDDEYGEVNLLLEDITKQPQN